MKRTLFSKTRAIVATIALTAFMPIAAFAQTTGASIPLCEITRTLSAGATGEDVRCLQRYLNWSGHKIAESGPGSPGNETSYFGTLTQGAVTRWQNANAARVLTPLGLATGTGRWGSFSFAEYVRIVRVSLGIPA